VSVLTDEKALSTVVKGVPAVEIERAKMTMNSQYAIEKKNLEKSKRHTGNQNVR
jgi:hypothetical protein